MFFVFKMLDLLSISMGKSIFLPDGEFVFNLLLKP